MGGSVREPRRNGLAVAFVVLLVNSAYLAAAPSATLFYYGNVALHVVLGAAVAIVAGLRLLAGRWRLTRPALAAAAIAGAGAGFGVVLAIVGATRPHQWLLVAHIASSVAGSTLLLIALVAARSRTDAPRARMLTACAVGACALVAAPFVFRVAAERRSHERYRIVNPTTPPLSMNQEGAGPDGPFFPSSANTNLGRVIPANFFMTSAACGRCHKDIYEQWSASVHHFSSFNNQWYRKSIEYMQDVVGTRPSKWCAGCHDHAVFFNGRFDRLIKEQIDTPEAQAGLACTSCHSIVRVNSSMGQGDFTVEYPPLHDLAVSDNPLLQKAHDTLLYLAPEPHRTTFLKPFHREQTAEFCATCHKVHLDVPVNGYRWFRGFNEYDNWQASGVSGQGARSFYYPPAPQKCADCHMPLVPSTDPAARDGKVRSHRFPGANTALPFVNHDQVQLKTVQDFLRDGQISVDVFGIARTAESAASDARVTLPSAEPRLSSTFAVGEESAQFGATAAWLAAPAEVLAPLNRIPVSVRRGESVRVEVVVRTRKVGHFFPGGTVDAFDVWVELEAVDDKGRVLLHSGAVAADGKGPVDPGAHFYRSQQLDAHGNVINKRNAWMTRSVAYVRLVPPGAADTVHYRLQVPDDAGSRILLRAKVNYRKFSWWNTQWAYAGVRDAAQPKPEVAPAYDDGRWVFTGDTSKVSGAVKAIPDLPITVMAQAEASLAVLPKDAQTPDLRPLLDPSVRERWNDYGIGLLLQGDLKGAEAAFLKVTAMDPGYADGPVNVARARIQEGNVTDAIPMLEAALGVNGGLASAHFFLGSALKTLGRYDQALHHLRLASDKYPRDRVVLDQIGRIQFLQRRFAEAIATFQRVLLIDPEDLQAHYNLLLCYQGAGDATSAAREQALYTRFKADESAQAITGPYRLKSPEDNNERQQIHEHRQPAPSDRRYPVRAAAAGAPF
jgi:tetratricopeptide (TPR) repeat protein